MKLRIHGDNIIECERALSLIALSLKGVTKSKKSSIFFPSYSILIDEKEVAQVELLGGHDRWNVNINIELAKFGAPLREATDAYVTILSLDNKTEELLLAIEFCNALPAGNNAWQRNGRAVTCAEIGIPYLYFAEIGGVELDENRVVKAPRFPNPIVPFSYLTSTKALNVICAPVYQSHPAITKELFKKYELIFGLENSLQLIKALIEGKSTSEPLRILMEKGLNLVQLLSSDRKRLTTFSYNEWKEILELESGIHKANWIENSKTKQIWKKKSSDKISVTPTFKKLIKDALDLNLLSIGASEIPICLVSGKNIQSFTNLLSNIYKKNESKEVVDEIKKKNKPFIIVWVTGFKPRGDDSRPDRGLIPLARMLFGNDIDILTIVFGPAIKYTWKVFRENSNKLAKDNGLWQTIIGLSNYVLVDSITSEYGAMSKVLSRDMVRHKAEVKFNAASPNGIFGEHDVDTCIHLLFSRNEKFLIFESMCNPPGGDWSGISFFDFKKLIEYRWTSLPRVSSIQAKRPDHIIQINTQEGEVFLVIESKNIARNLDEDIGNRLKLYLEELLKIPPTAFKMNQLDWSSYESDINPLKSSFKVFSGAAFLFNTLDEMKSVMKSGKLDFILAIDFQTNGNSIGHLLLSPKTQFLVPIINKILDKLYFNFEIKIY